MVVSIEEHSVARLVLTTAGDIGNASLAEIYRDLELHPTSSDRRPNDGERGQGFYEALCARSTANDLGDERCEAWLLFGGPGQGKSTLTQWAAITSWQQALRADDKHSVAALIDLGFDADRARKCARLLERIEARARSIVRNGALEWFALRVDLPRFVEFLASGDSPDEPSEEACLTAALLGVTRAAEDVATIADLRSCATRWRSLWLFDAADEVAGASARASVAQLVDACRTSDNHVVVTSRPQGYDGLVDARERSRRDASSVQSMFVRTLSTKQSKALAADLVAIEFAEQPTERDRIAQSVARAFADAHASELFRTPLFVSIVLPQIATHDVLPTSRSLLFERMYDTLLARESRKNVGNVRQAVLTHYRWAVAALHERVALLLHVRTDSGGVASGISTGELRRIADEVVRERVSNVRTREQLVADLLFFAEQRLVLIAQHEVGRHRFDVRLVQEHFAARAMFAATVPLELRIERLRAIGPHARWRQVLVFAASTWVETNDSVMIDALFECCRACNDESGEGVHKAIGLVRTGTEIAVTVLSEGVFDGAPDAAERLWNVALEGGWERAVRVREMWFAAATKFATSLPALRERFLDAVQVAASKRGARMALELLFNEWKSHQANDARRILESCVLENEAMATSLWDRLLTSWDSRVRELRVWMVSSGVPVVDFWNASSLGYRIRHLSYKEESQMPVFAGFRAWARLRDEIWARRVKMNVGMSGACLAFAWFRLRQTTTNVLDVERDSMPDMLRHSERWRAWLAFELRPSLDTLVATIPLLSHASDAELWSMSRHSSWPLAALLREVANGRDLDELTEHISRGDWQDFDSWDELEKAALSGNSMLDFHPELKRVWCLGSDIGLRAWDDADIEAWSRKIRDRSPLIRAFFNTTEFRGDVLGSFAPFIEQLASQLSSADFAWLAALTHRPMSNSLRGNSVVEYFQFLNTEVAHNRRYFCPSMVAPTRREERAFLADSLLGLRLADGPGVHRQLYSVGVMTAEAQNDVLKTPQPREADEAWAALVFCCREADGTLIERAIQILTRGNDIAETYLRRIILRAQLDIEHPDRRYPSPAWLSRFTALLDAVIRVHSSLESDAADLVRLLLSLLPGPFASPDDITRLKLPIHPSIPTQPAMIEPLVTLTRFSVRNMRSIESVEVAPSAPAADRGQWIVLLGDNGVGKTSVLRGLALALVEPRFAWPGPESESSRLVRASTHDAEARVWFRQGDRERETSCRLSLDDSNLESWTYDTENDRPFVVAYGVGRTTVDGSTASTIDEPKAIRSLFDHAHALVSARHWLNTLDGEDAALISGSLRSALADALAPVGVEDVRLSAEHGFTFTGASVGHDIALHHLSDGYQSVVAWVTDLMARWVAMRKRARRPIERNFQENMAGVVLVDEIDQHLHPLWQRDFVQSLRRVFPRLTFVATTHNPLAVIELRDGELFRVHRNDQGRVCVDPLPAVRGRHSDDVLTGAWFGLGSTLDDETLEWMEQHRRLLRDRPEDPARAELEEKIRHRTQRYADLAIERIALSVAQELMDEEEAQWQRAERSSPEQRAQLRSSLLERVREKLKERRENSEG